MHCANSRKVRRAAASDRDRPSGGGCQNLPLVVSRRGARRNAVMRTACGASVRPMASAAALERRIDGPELAAKSATTTSAPVAVLTTSARSGRGRPANRRPEPVGAVRAIAHGAALEEERPGRGAVLEAEADAPGRASPPPGRAAGGERRRDGERQRQARPAAPVAALMPLAAIRASEGDLAGPRPRGKGRLLDEVRRAAI